MNIEEISKRINENKNIYLYDDYERIVVKLMPTDNGTQAFVKYKGKEEYKVDVSAKIVFEAEINGEEVSEEFYKNF